MILIIFYRVYRIECKNKGNNMKEDKDLLHHNVAYKIGSFLLYLIAYPILAVLDFTMFGLKINGRKNIPKGPYIFVCNHVNELDCTWLALAQFPKVPYYLTLQSNLEIPFVKYIVMLLRGVPIPREIDGKKKLIFTVSELLQKNNILGIYPEGELIRYSKKLRSFKSGAFEFAVKNNVKVLPMVAIYRKPKGLLKLLKRKPCITLKILKPIKLQDANDLQKQVYNAMKNEIDGNKN